MAAPRRVAVADSAGPTALRLPKGRVGPPLPALDRYGRAEVLFRTPGTGSAPVLLVGVGAMSSTAVAAASELGRLPVEDVLLAAAARSQLVVTLENQGVAGGYGDAFARAMRTAGLGTELLTLGLPQRFLPHGDRGGLPAGHGLDVPGVVTTVHGALDARSTVRPLARPLAQDIQRARAR